MHLVPYLENLGLNNKEAEVYLALLQLGKATAPSVAKKSGLKKPTTYVILEQLIEKGFVQKPPAAKKQYYLAVSPDKCLELRQRKIEETKNVLPALLALKKNAKEEKVSVLYFEGVNGAKEMYRHATTVLKKKPIDQRQIVGFYAKADAWNKELSDALDQSVEELREYQISRRAITVYHPSVVEKYFKPGYLEKYLTQVKALDPKIYSSNVSIETYDNYVQILSQRLLQAIIIEDLDIAHAIKQIFELVWKTRPEKAQGIEADNAA